MNCVDGCKYFEEVTGDYHRGFCRLNLPHWVAIAKHYEDERKVHGDSWGCDLGKKANDKED